MTYTLRVNDQFLTKEQFSEIACLDGRLFGVRTFCETCGMDFNSCLRRHVSSLLLSNQEFVERELGFNLTPRYHVEEIFWDGRERIQLSWPGLQSVNVVESSTLLTTVTVSPFIQENADTENSGQGFCLLRISDRLVGTPNQIVVRQASNNAVIPQQTISGFPKRENGEWVIALDKPSLPPCSQVLNVQHCKYIAVTIPTPTCTGEVKAVIPGTQTVIPFAKPPTVLGSNTTYWFYVWSLVDPAFDTENADMVQGEFYKLLPSVSFICVASTAMLPTLLYSESCDCEQEEYQSTTENIRIEIVSRSNSIIRVTRPQTSRCLSNCQKPIRLTIYYKTNPAYLDFPVPYDQIKNGIAYLTAAQLPLKSCDCDVDSFKRGFIAEAQAPYATYHALPTGEVVSNLRFGQLHGHLVFHQRMKSIPKYQRLMKL